MTEKNKTIWHTPDEQLPEDGKTIVFLVPNVCPMVGQYWGEASDVFNDFYTDGAYKSTEVDSWAYLRDLIATSKALYVAIKALERLRDLPEEDNDKWFMHCCPSCVLSEINSIMKEDK